MFGTQTRLFAEALPAGNPAATAPIQPDSTGGTAYEDQPEEAGPAEPCLAKAAARRVRQARHRAKPSQEADAADLLVRRSLPLTVPAPNWEAWCRRPLRMEVRTAWVHTSLPMVMTLNRDNSMCPVPHGTFHPDEFRRGFYWLAEDDPEHGTILVPRGRFWIGSSNGSVEDRLVPGIRLRVVDEDEWPTKKGSCPTAAAAEARRLHQDPAAFRPASERQPVSEADVDRLLRACAGAHLALHAGLGKPFADCHDQLHIASRPFLVEAGSCGDGRIRLAGPMGITCEARYDAIYGVRVLDGVTGDRVLIDLWRHSEGYGAAWNLQFTDVPNSHGDEASEP